MVYLVVCFDFGVDFFVEFFYWDGVEIGWFGSEMIFDQVDLVCYLVVGWFCMWIVVYVQFQE